VTATRLGLNWNVVDLIGGMAGALVLEADVLFALDGEIGLMCLHEPLRVMSTIPRRTSMNSAIAPLLSLAIASRASIYARVSAERVQEALTAPTLRLGCRVL
jgi:hypothetical protein